MSLLDIQVLGSPILRKETALVRTIDDSIQRLIDDMFETMHAARGIGLAAPQVGRTERLTVIDVSPREESRPLVLINPEIVVADGGLAKAEEGCLSIPEVYGEVERPAHVIVRALDRSGEPFEIEATELLARCLQHEIDHLHGKLFIDYLSVLKKKAALATWDEFRGNYPGLVRTVRPGEGVTTPAEHPDDENL
jgi:peptide deformylase